MFPTWILNISSSMRSTRHMRKYYTETTATRGVAPRPSRPGLYARPDWPHGAETRPRSQGRPRRGGRGGAVESLCPGGVAWSTRRGRGNERPAELLLPEQPGPPSPPCCALRRRALQLPACRELDGRASSVESGPPGRAALPAARYGGDTAPAAGQPQAAPGEADLGGHPHPIIIPRCDRGDHHRKGAC